MSDRLKNMHEAAEWLGISWETLRKKVSARQVPHTRIGGQVRFTQAHLDAIVAAGEQPVAKAPSRLQVVALRAPQLARPPSNPPTTPPPPAGPRTPPPPAGPRKSTGQKEVDAA